MGSKRADYIIDTVLFVLWSKPWLHKSCISSVINCVGWQRPHEAAAWLYQDLWWRWARKGTLSAGWTRSQDKSTSPNRHLTFWPLSELIALENKYCPHPGLSGFAVSIHLCNLGWIYELVQHRDSLLGPTFNWHPMHQQTSAHAGYNINRGHLVRYRGYLGYNFNHYQWYKTFSNLVLSDAQECFVALCFGFMFAKSLLCQKREMEIIFIQMENMNENANPDNKPMHCCFSLSGSLFWARQIAVPDLWFRYIFAEGPSERL